MEEINLEGQYDFCGTAQQSYNYKCLNGKCGYNKFTGICHFRGQFESGEMIKIDPSTAIQRLISGETMGFVDGIEILVLNHENSQSTNQRKGSGCIF